MSSSQNSGMGIGDFAQSLFEQEIASPTPKPKRSNLPGNVPDISDVEVIQESVDNVLSNSFGISNPTKPEVSIKKNRKVQLKEEIKQKISELKSLLTELGVTPGSTTTGGLGVKLGGKSNELNSNGTRSRRKKPK